MKKIKIVIGVLLLFAAGALAGSLITGMVFKNRFEKFARGGGPPIGRILQRISSELDLSKSQKTEIEKILQGSHTQLSGIKKKYQPEFQKIIETTYAQINAKLEDKQREKADRLFAKFKKRFQRRGFRPKRGFGKPKFVEGENGRILSDLKERLDLSAEQEENIRPIIEEDLIKRRIIIEKARKLRRRARLATANELQEHRMVVEKHLQKILTPEQMEEYRQFDTGLPLGPPGPFGFGGKNWPDDATE
ncbi:hypothetical protein QUF75_06870 [Desulfococcaceae bacterium HSG7]|nr:hypothetical protein [Desulfococcaceae bacterium HSG7]